MPLFLSSRSASLISRTPRTPNVSSFSVTTTAGALTASQDDNDDDDNTGSKKSEKRMRYKDVVREQILQAQTAEDAISSDDDSDGDGNNRRNRNDNGGEGRRGLAYDEEQKQLRKGFLGSIAEHDGDGARGEEGGDDSGDEAEGLLKVLVGVFCVCVCACACSGLCDTFLCSSVDSKLR